ncbi:MAG: HAD family hydrolase, partial [Candidatus Dormibacteraceae bacterium]
DILLHKLEDRSLNPSSATYIGDSLRDLDVAMSRGLNFIGVLTGQTTEAEFRERGDDFEVVESLCCLL